MKLFPHLSAWTKRDPEACCHPDEILPSAPPARLPQPLPLHSEKCHKSCSPLYPKGPGCQRPVEGNGDPLAWLSQTLPQGHLENSRSRRQGPPGAPETWFLFLLLLLLSCVTSSKSCPSLGLFPYLCTECAQGLLLRRQGEELARGLEPAISSCA